MSSRRAVPRLSGTKSGAVAPAGAAVGPLPPNRRVVPPTLGRRAAIRKRPWGRSERRGGPARSPDDRRDVDDVPRLGWPTGGAKPFF